MIYSGIGPRNTPIATQSQMSGIGKQLQEMGFILSSGDGLGADQAWAEQVKPENTRIFLAGSKPNCSHGIVPDFLQEQWEFANNHFAKHRGGMSLTTQSAYIQYLFMRNVNILLGGNLAEQQPVDFVAYWYNEDRPNGWAGGTGHTVSMARDPLINIPCFNIALEKDCAAMDALVMQLLESK